MAIVESSDDAIVSKDLNGIISSWNPSAEHLFGYSAAEAIGQPITLIIPEDLRDEETYILQCIRYGEPIHHCETSRVTKDGKRLRVLLTVSPLMNSSGVIVGASKIVRDITAHKEAEQALRDSEERFRLFMNHSPAVAWMKDQRGHYIYVNETYEKHFGIQLRDRLATGTSWIFTLAPLPSNSRKTTKTPCWPVILSNSPRNPSITKEIPAFGSRISSRFTTLPGTFLSVASVSMSPSVAKPGNRCKFWPAA